MFETNNIVENEAEKHTNDCAEDEVDDGGREEINHYCRGVLEMHTSSEVVEKW
jgi:hypothetical protein